MPHVSPHPSSAAGALRRLRSKVRETIGEILGDEPLRDEGVLEHRAVDAHAQGEDEQAKAGRRARVAGVRIRDAQLVADRMAIDAERRSGEDRVAIERRRRGHDEDAGRALARQAEEAERRRAELHEAVTRNDVQAILAWSDERRVADRAEHAAARARHQADLLSPGRRPDDPPRRPRSR